MEILEEFRNLTLEEWNSKEILCEKLTELLHQQKIYWKQRGTVKWVKFGDASTKFFHVTATIRHRKKMMPVLQLMMALITTIMPPRQKFCGWPTRKG